MSTPGNMSMIGDAARAAMSEAEPLGSGAEGAGELGAHTSQAECGGGGADMQAEQARASTAAAGATGVELPSTANKALMKVGPRPNAGDSSNKKTKTQLAKVQQSAGKGKIKARRAAALTEALQLSVTELAVLAKVIAPVLRNLPDMLRGRMRPHVAEELRFKGLGMDMGRLDSVEAFRLVDFVRSPCFNDFRGYIGSFTDVMDQTFEPVSAEDDVESEPEHKAAVKKAGRSAAAGDYSDEADDEGESSFEGSSSSGNDSSSSGSGSSQGD